jgi:hypothetical protein
LIYRKLLLIIAGVLSLFFYSCKDNPTLVGANLLKNDYLNVKQLDSYTDSLQQTSSSYKKVIPLGGSNYLLVGNNANVQASTLIKYAISLPDSMITDLNNSAVSIISSSIYFIPIYTYGDSNASFDFSVHKVNSVWTTIGFDADSLSGLAYDQTDISSNHQLTDSLVSVNISNTVTENWLKDVGDSTYNTDYGIYISPVSAKKVVGFELITASATYGLSLQIVLQKSGVYTDTLTFYPSEATSVVTGSMPSAVQGDMFIQSGLSVNSKLWVDISSIPKNANINSATLTLTKDTVSTITGSSYSNTLTVYMLKDSSTNLVDSTISANSLYSSNNTFTGSISSFIQSWVDGKSNQGLLLKTAYPAEGLELFAVKSSNAANLSVRPRLQITYTIKK